MLNLEIMRIRADKPQFSTESPRAGEISNLEINLGELKTALFNSKYSSNRFLTPGFIQFETIQVMRS